MSSLLSAFGLDAASKRRRWTVVALVLGMASGARGVEIWRLDNVGRIGNQAVTLVGQPKVIDAVVGKALAFDGQKDAIFVPVIPIAGSKSFTIEVLFRPATDGNEAQRFFHLQDEQGRRGLLEIRKNDKGEWWLDAFLRTDLEDERKGVTLIDPHHTHRGGEWHWVAMRYDGKHFVNFVDGQKELEAAAEFTALGQGKVSIGVRQNLVYWFKGAIAEVRFHREAIADEQLQRVK